MFNFLLSSRKEDGLENLRYEAVESESETDAIKTYILGDSSDTGYVASLVLNVLEFEDTGHETYEIARILRDKFEKVTGLELGYIPEFYAPDKIKQQFVEDGYRQAIDENLDEITKFIDYVSRYTYGSYFQILKIDRILTGSIVKSAAKQ